MAWRRTIPIVLLLLCCCLLLSACGGATGGMAGREPTNEELIEDFLRTVFEFDSYVYGKRNLPDALRKREGPIRLLVLGEPTAAARSKVEETRRLYASLIDIPFEDARPGYDANFVLVFIPSLPPEQVFNYLKAEYQKASNAGFGIHIGIRGGIDYGTDRSFLARRYYTAGEPGYTNAYCMVRMGPRSAVIFISRDYFRLSRCIAEEMLQALELQNDTRKWWPSIMTADGGGGYPREASRYDLLYLRLLYDPRLKVGMTRNQTKPLALQILNELRSNPGSALSLNSIHTVPSGMGEKK